MDIPIEKKDNPIRILIVDDDPDNLVLLQEQLLLSLNCLLLIAQGGSEAIALAIANRPDVILLDIMMPELDGIQVMQQLQQDPITQAIPVIAITAMARLQDEEQIISAGAKAYIRKPYDLETLIAAIETILNSRS